MTEDFTLRYFPRAGGGKPEYVTIHSPLILIVRDLKSPTCTLVGVVKQFVMFPCKNHSLM